MISITAHKLRITLVSRSWMNRVYFCKLKRLDAKNEKSYSQNEILWNTREKNGNNKKKKP